MVDSGEKCNAWRNSECVGTPFCPPRCPRFFDTDGKPLVARPVDEDLDALKDMYRSFDASDRTMGIPPADESVLETWLKRFLSDGVNIVVEESDRILGHSGAVQSTSEAAKLIVFVRKESRSRGIGTELIKQLIAYAANRGFDSLALDVLKTNERAVRVYRNVNFDITAKQQETLEMYIDLDSPTAEQVQRPPDQR